MLPVFYSNTRDRCYDFKSIFAERIGVFWLKTKLNYAEFSSYHWFLRKKPIFTPKIVKNFQKLQKIMIITSTPVRDLIRHLTKASLPVNPCLRVAFDRVHGTVNIIRPHKYLRYVTARGRPGLIFFGIGSGSGFIHMYFGIGLFRAINIKSGLGHAWALLNKWKSRAYARPISSNSFM
jgi:hypothetical protein